MSKNGNAGPAVRGSSRYGNTHRTTLTCTACEDSWSLERSEDESTLSFGNRLYLARKNHIQDCEAAGVRVIDGEAPMTVVPSETEVLS